MKPASVFLGLAVLAAMFTVGCGGGQGSMSPPPAASKPPGQPTTPPPPPVPPKNWSVTDLPPLPGAQAAQANALNNQGRIVGYSVANGIAHATLWENGMVLDLGANTFANGINDAGQIVGYRLDDSLHAHAHLWPDDIDLGSLPGFDSSVATGINNHGNVVGIALNASNTNQQTAFTCSVGSGMKVVPGCASAEAINDSGQIAEIASNLDASVCGVSDFGQKGAAGSINSAGVAAGYAGPEAGTDAFLFPSTDLGPTLADQ